MRACEHCGLAMGDTATFCTVCGARVGTPASTASAATGSPVVQAAGQDDHAAPAHEDAQLSRRQEASLPLGEPRFREKTDPARAAALYRDAIVGLLEAAADPLEHEGVRHDLLLSFDRLSLVLKREGLPAEALEEIDCAASLGLLDCQDRGIKGHRESLAKRRENLRRALDAESLHR